MPQPNYLAALRDIAASANGSEPFAINSSGIARILQRHGVVLHPPKLRPLRSRRPVLCVARSYRCARTAPRQASAQAVQLALGHEAKKGHCTTQMYDDDTYHIIGMCCINCDWMTHN